MRGGPAVSLKPMEADTNDLGHFPEPKRAPVLDPVDRVTEMLFGLFMALTFVGAISISNSQHEEFAPYFTLPWAATWPGAWSMR